MRSSENENPAGASGGVTGSPRPSDDAKFTRSAPDPQARQKRWRERNPAAYVAHLTVHNALRLGVLERRHCTVCGETRTDAHHPDYSQPLHVVWLCRPHHLAAHREAARKGRENG